MTSDSEKEGRRTVKEYFTRKIAFTTDLMNEYKLKSQTVESRNESTAMKAFYASVHFTCNQHIETLEILDGFIGSLFAVNDEIRAKILNLDKIVQNIAEKTGVDLSEMKTQVAEIKGAVEGPIYRYVKTQQDTEEKRKKLEDELLDWALRSH